MTILYLAAFGVGRGYRVFRRLVIELGVGDEAKKDENTQFIPAAASMISLD